MAQSRARKGALDKMSAHSPPHPSPLPWGEGESDAALDFADRAGLGKTLSLQPPLPEGEGWGEGEPEP